MSDEPKKPWVKRDPATFRPMTPTPADWVPGPKHCGHERRNGMGLCRQYKLPGGNYCAKHTGSAAKGIRERWSKKLRARATIGQAIEHYGGVVEGDPLLCLAAMVKTASLMEAVCKDKVMQLEKGEELVRLGAAAGFREEPHPYLRLWLDAQQWLAKISKLALDADVERRTADIKEIEAKAVVVAIMATIDALPITAEMRVEARRIAAQQLRIVQMEATP